MIKWLMPREDKFFPLFNRHAATIVQGALALNAMLAGETPVEEGCRQIAQHENEADAIAREVQLGVHRTFITPFDRGDIKDLISLLDDSIDQMQKTAKAVMLFEVREFTPTMRELGEVIVEASKLTAESVGLLPSLSRNAARINALAVEIARIEGRSDDLYDQGVRSLFQANKGGDAMVYIVGAEIYDHLEKVVDRLEDVSNRINGVLIEHL